MKILITINIEESESGYQGWLEFHDTKIYFENPTKVEMLKSAKEQIEDYLKHEGKHLKIDSKNIMYMFKFI